MSVGSGSSSGGLSKSARVVRGVVWIGVARGLAEVDGLLTKHKKNAKSMPNTGAKNRFCAIFSRSFIGKTLNSVIIAYLGENYKV